MIVINKREQRTGPLSYLLLFAGCILVCGLLFAYRGGATWFLSVNWSKLSISDWLAIGIIFIPAFFLQYYFLLLLRYSALRYLVFRLIPILWLCANGLVAIHKFISWTTDIAPSAGWISVNDLFGYLLGIAFSPLLLGSGMIIAILDISSNSLISICLYVGMALKVINISSPDIISYTIDFSRFLWDLMSNSFVQQILSENTNRQDFLHFNLLSTFRFPYWVQNLGYSLTCITI